MSTDTTEPIDAVDVHPRPHTSPFHRVTVVVATICVFGALVGLVWGTRPLTTPTQDCGTAFSFLLDGRVDQFVDPSNPPEGITAEEARANNDRPCQERAATRSRPAGALVVGGTLMASATAAVDLAVRGVRRYRRVHQPSVHARLPL